MADTPSQDINQIPTTTTVTTPAHLAYETTVTNPLADLSPADLRAESQAFAQLCGVTDAAGLSSFDRAAQLAAGHPFREPLPRGELSERERLCLEGEGRKRGKFRLSGMMWFVAGLMAVCAATQGMDETVINGAQIFFREEFGLEESPVTLGLVVGAPYLCCAVFGCWISNPLNRRLGRLKTIFFANVVTVLACVGTAFTTGTWSMFGARLALGIGIGVSSASVPVFSAETAPPAVRGGLSMLWQVFTAFGIMVGNAVSLAFFKVPKAPHGTGLNWRLMMGAPAVPALIVCCFIFFCHESPSWLMGREFGLTSWFGWLPGRKVGELRYAEAYASMCRLRPTELQAARDLFKAYKQQLAEWRLPRRYTGFKSMLELVAVPRNRRAFIASELVMISQQLCGVNIVAYFSTDILLTANLTQLISLGVSLALGATNFLFAIPALWSIDRYGRRFLMLLTLPFMAVFLFLTGASFYLPSGSTSQVAVTLTGLFLFLIAYSPGPGPVPFPYAAECWPLYVRTLGMSLNTATTWAFNFALSISFLYLKDAIGPAGSFFLYGGFNLVLMVLIWLFLPETKQRTLEELDGVFKMGTRRFIAGNAGGLGLWGRAKTECTYSEERSVALSRPEAGKEAFKMVNGVKKLSQSSSEGGELAGHSESRSREEHISEPRQRPETPETPFRGRSRTRSTF